MKPQWQPPLIHVSHIEQENKRGPVKNKPDNRKWTADTMSPLFAEQSDKRLLFIILKGAFHSEMTFTGGPSSLSPSVVFLHIGKTHPQLPTSPG